MAQCLVKRVGSMFKATISVQANVGATITATGNGKTFSAVADSATGIANIIVKKKGTYTLNTDSTGKYDATGNTSAVIVSKGKEIYAAQLVKLTHGYTAFKVTNEYASKTLLPYWTGTLDSTLCNGNILEEIAADGTATKIYSGEGTSYTVNTSLTATGYLISNIASGTTKTYRLGAYITINSKNFYGGYMTASGTAADYSSVLGWKTYKSTQTITVPKGCHSITAYAVGGGGGGGDYNNVRTKSGSYYYNYYSGCGGGGGGYQSNGSIAVVPGQTIAVTIGAGGSRGYYWISSGKVQRIGGGSGGTTSISCNGKTISASGGHGGAVHNQNNSNGSSPNSSAGGSGTGSGGTGSYTNSGNGGSGKSINGTTYSGGGGGGGGYYYYDKTSSSGKFHLAGNGGSGGGGNGGGATANWSSSLNKTSTAGTANSGGGGGGGCAGATGSSLQWKGCSQPGGSGVAFINFAA